MNLRTRALHQYQKKDRFLWLEIAWRPTGLFCDESKEHVLENCASPRCGSDVQKTIK